MTKLFTLKEGDQFTVRLFPTVFTVVRPFCDTVGPVEISGSGLFGTAFLNALTEVTQL